MLVQIVVIHIGPTYPIKSMVLKFWHQDQQPCSLTSLFFCTCEKVEFTSIPLNYHMGEQITASFVRLSNGNCPPKALR